MNDRIELTRENRYRIGASSIILLGFALRLFQLGFDSLWNDEAGQVLAALASSIEDMIEIERTHVMAMPLDYLVTRLASSLGITEFVLRLPSVFWGMLAISLVFSFLKSCNRPNEGLIAAVLLGISVTHIHYSQEVRFYSSLVFFYLLSTYLLLKGLAKPSVTGFLVTAVITSIGAYFHPFVLLSLLNGYVYLLLDLRDRRTKRNVLQLAVLSIVIFAMFLPGYLYFDRPKMPFLVLEFGGSLFDSIARGIGWDLTPLGVVLGLLGIIGLLSLRLRDRIIVATVVATMIQIPIIIAAVYIKGYWFAPRQIVHLLPVFSMLTAIGLVTLFSHIPRSTGLSRTNAFGYGATGVLTALIFMLTASHLSDYYRWNKSNGREVAYQIAQESRAKSCILIAPGYETVIYQFYFSHLFDRPDLIRDLHPINGDITNLTSDCHGQTIFLAISRQSNEHYQDDIAHLGFDVIGPQLKTQSESAHLLYELVPRY